jgi:hypothetical protein
MSGNKMENKKVVKTFFHPDAENEYIVSEILTEDGLISKIIPMEVVLDRLVTFPQIKITDSKILKKAEELLLL